MSKIHVVWVMVILLAFAVVLGAWLVGTGHIPFPPTVTPTATVTVVPTATKVIPIETATALPTATVIPTVTDTPTETETPTATPDQTVWNIAKVMLAECKKGDWNPQYGRALRSRVAANYPLFGGSWMGGIASGVISNDGSASNPFAFWNLPDNTPVDGEDATCLDYLLLYKNTPENTDGDGVLTGEAYLFYEVGGTSPTTIDGKLKEVHFFFPSAN